MRSIGAWKIKKLKKIVEDECAKEKDRGTYSWRGAEYTKGIELRERIKIRIPQDWYETWECAWSEIERLSDDFINDYQYGRKA